jgi:hypothetical protein
MSVVVLCAGENNVDGGDCMSESKKESSMVVKKKNSKSNKLNLRIADEELETLNMISYEDDEPVSQIVRKAIRVYSALRKNKKGY